MSSFRTWLRWSLALPLAVSCAALAQPAPPSAQEQPETAEAHETTDDGDPDGDAAARPVTYAPLLDAAAPIASGRGLRVTAGEVYERLADAPPALLQRYAMDPAALQDLVDRLVADRLLAAEAQRRGMMDDPVVRATLERVLVARLRATAINPDAGDARAVTDAEVQAWYDAHPERFHIPERRRARVIFVPSRRDASNVLRLALALRRRRPVNEFRDLAARYNADPALAASRGDLRDVTPAPTPGTPDVDPALRAAIYGLRDDGQVLPTLVPGRWNGVAGFFVVKRLSRRAPVDRTLAQSAAWIRERLVLERRVAAERAFVERLAAQARVTTVPLARVVAFDGGVAADGGAVAGR